MRGRASNPEGAAATTRASRTPASVLFWRLFLINGLVFAVGLTVLALSPATVSSPVLLNELPVLTVGLVLMLAANAILIRVSLAPLNGLTALMERVDLLRTQDRFPVSDAGDLARLIETFNAMLDRLQAERGASSARALAAQEAERQRIAQELHDEIGQSLTAVLLGLKRAVDTAPADLRDDLQAVQATVRGRLDEVRQVARRLRPGTLEDLGLLNALDALTTEFGEISGIPVERRFDRDLPVLSAEAELVLYRIAQESLTNVARHAHASRVQLCLTAEPHQVLMRVVDDGKGMAGNEGAGIRGMRDRALLIGASLVIRSPAARGTEVRLVVPMAEHR